MKLTRKLFALVPRQSYKNYRWVKATAVQQLSHFCRRLHHVVSATDRSYLKSSVNDTDRGGVWRRGRQWQSSRHYKLLISAECFIKCQSASPWARHWKMAALWCAGTSPAALCTHMCVCVCEWVQPCVSACVCFYICVCPSHVAVKQNRVAGCPLLSLLSQYKPILFQPVISHV